jgi:hypothetical protein
MLSATKLEDNIYYYTDAYPDPELFLEQVKLIPSWREWLSSGSEVVYGDVVGGAIPLPAYALDTLKKAVYQCVYDYCLKTGNDFGWIPEYYTINRYDNDKYMGPHVDSIDRTIEKSPTISIVVYLNDDYEGGEISFPNQDITLKPKAGSIIVFPSYDPYIHDPKPTTSGDKYMSPVFCFKKAF